MKQSILISLVTLLCLVGSKSIQVNAAENSEPIAEVSDEDGQEIFGRMCQQCHNSRGIGGKCPTLVRGAWVPGGPNTDQFMFDTIHDGRAGTQMGAFGGIFTDAEIWAIVKYLRQESVRIKTSDDLIQDDEDFDRR